MFGGTAEGSSDQIRKAWDAGAEGIWGQSVGARFGTGESELGEGRRDLGVWAPEGETEGPGRSAVSKTRQSLQMLPELTTCHIMAFTTCFL